MKLLPSLSTFGLALTALASVAHAQVYIVSTGDKPAQRNPEITSLDRPAQFISTSGTAEIRVVPDLADLQFQIKVRNRDFEAARKDAGERAARVLAALRAAGVKEADLRASQTKISTAYDQRPTRDETDVRYFQVVQDFGCTLHDTSKVAEVTGAVVTAGVTEVGEAQLRTSELRKYRDEARHKAAVAAHEKAAALAAEIGMKLGKANSIREESTYGGSAQNNVMSQNVSATVPGGAPDNDEASFAPGMISVSASVAVGYVLEE